MMNGLVNHRVNGCIQRQPPTQIRLDETRSEVMTVDSNSWRLFRQEFAQLRFAEEFYASAAPGRSLTTPRMSGRVERLHKVAKSQGGRRAWRLG